MYKLEEIKNTIIQGNASDVLKNIPNNSINCGITSPPYFGLRNYNTNPIVWCGNDNCNHIWENDFCTICNAWQGELGLEPTVDLYINHLVSIFDEVKRVLKNDGTLWVNIADTYSGSGLGSGKISCTNKGKQVRKNLTNGQTYFPNPRKDSTVKKKSLYGIPFRFALAMINNGWILRNTIIWHKPNTMPYSGHDRFTYDFEYVFFFVKNRHYFFNQQFEPLKDSTIKRSLSKSKVGKRDVYGTMNTENSNTYMQKILNGEVKERNKRSIWSISTHGIKEAHFATYPKELVKQCLQAGCPVDGIVLDPFMGSGTTGLVAREMDMNYIGIELNKEYSNIAEKRLKK